MKHVLLATTLLIGTSYAATPQLGVKPLNKKECPTSHPIKGNITQRGKNKGEKIFHVPKGRSYKRTHPERCFKNVAEAKKAGFRAAKR